MLSENPETPHEQRTRKLTDSHHLACVTDASYRWLFPGEFPSATQANITVTSRKLRAKSRGYFPGAICLFQNEAWYETGQKGLRLISINMNLWIIESESLRLVCPQILYFVLASSRTQT